MLSRLRPAKRMLFVMILIILTACQQTLVSYNDPTGIAVSPTMPQPLVIQATPVPRTIATREVTPTPLQAARPTPFQLGGPWLSPTPADTLPPDTQVVGHSVEGRAIIARRFGQGPQMILLVGGIHGGWEGNTVTLINELIAHFDANPQDVLPGVSLMLIPVANPDGLLRGRTEMGRFNAHTVDLNRNWGCGWSADAQWRDQSVNPGLEPFSEPETRALSAFIQNARPALVLFYHSAAGGIFAGRCNGDDAGSEAVAQVLGEATGYSYGAPFSAYPVTGTGPSWVASLGIPSADVELQTWTDSEFERNLRGIVALQRWLSASS